MKTSTENCRNFEFYFTLSSFSFLPAKKKMPNPGIGFLLLQNIIPSLPIRMFGGIP